MVLLTSNQIAAARNYPQQAFSESEGYFKRTDQRPFRAGYKQLARDWDKAKQLGSVDHGGIASSSGVIVAAVDQEWVGAFHQKGLQPIWWIKHEGGLSAPPVIYGSWVILGFRNGSILKLELLTGKKVWKAKLNSFVNRKFAKANSNLVAVAASQTVYNLDFKTGQIKWIFDAGFPTKPSIRSLSAATIYDNKVYLGLSSGELISLFLKTGKMNWKHNPEPSPAKFSDVVGHLNVVNKDLLFTRYDGFVDSISSTNPKIRSKKWKQPIRLSAISISTVRQGRLFIGTVNGYLYAYNIYTGKKLWESKTGGTISSITAGESNLYISTTTGQIFALAAATGSMIWHDHLNTSISTPPVYIDKELYFMTNNKALYGYRI